MAHFHKSAKERGICHETSSFLLKSIGKSTLSSYSRYWKRFNLFFIAQRPRCDLSTNLICKFLISLFKTGASCSSINIARCALSLFLTYDLDIKNDATISRLFQSFYKQRPLKIKHFTFWPVKQVLDHLASFHPPSSLTLKQLTLKTVALIALTCSDRGQTMHLMNIENATISPNSISFVIFDPLKHTKKVVRPKVIKCLSSDIPELNVCDYVTAYMNRTITIRASHVAEGKEKPTQLFLSWATKGPITRQTLSRWLKITLKNAGIDVSQFSGHSFRGAGLSSAYSHGASLQ